jgi:hypothetical protein
MSDYTSISHYGDDYISDFVTAYDSVTVPYTSELFSDVLECMTDYYTTGYTVCGVEDPAVICLSAKFIAKRPELNYTMVRVIDKFINPNQSETLLEFSNEDITSVEYTAYEELWADLDTPPQGTA